MFAVVAGREDDVAAVGRVDDGVVAVAEAAAAGHGDAVVAAAADGEVGGYDYGHTEGVAGFGVLVDV